MKKALLALSTILTMLVLIICLTLSASAEDTIHSGTWGDLSWTINITTGELTISGTGSMNNFSYPPTSAWNYYKTSIKSIVIGDGVTSIGNCAFSDCSNLIRITIGNSVTSIGDYAFYGCRSLTSITIPSSVTSIGDYAFYYCSDLETISVQSGNSSYHSNGNCLIETESKTLILGCKNSVIPTDGSITSINKYAFSGCSRLTSITIPEGVTSIGEGAFSGCSSLTSITIPEGVKSIDDFAFWDCSSLKSITIPDSVTSIGFRAFFGCSNIKIATIPTFAISSIPKTNLQTVVINGGTSIGNKAFYDCTTLKSITIHDSVTSIGDSAFKLCSSLTSITIPDSVTSIGEEAFYNCRSLTNITIPDSVKSVGEWAFSGCSGLTSLTLLDSVKNIGKYAFYDCSSLTSITIPDSVTSIGDFAFSGCASFLNVYVSCKIDWNAVGGSNSGVPFNQIQENHTWNDGEITTPATHLATGIKTFTCSDCGATKTEDIATTPEEQTTQAPNGSKDEKSGCGATVSSGVGLMFLLTAATFGISRKKKKQ